jgi:hypothetical protein
VAQDAGLKSVLVLRLDAQRAANTKSGVSKNAATVAAKSKFFYRDDLRF